MKKILTIGAVCICAIMGPRPALPATKCVKLSSSTTCTSSASSYLNKANWSATCGGIAVSGVAVCSSTGGTTVGSSATSVAFSATTESNKNCKCKIVSPVVSRWVAPGSCTDTSCYVAGMVPADVCSKYCAYMCASTISDKNNGQRYQEFISAIFSNLTD